MEHIKEETMEDSHIVMHGKIDERVEIPEEVRKGRMKK